MKKQDQAARPKDWADIAIDSWVSRRVGRAPAKKKAARPDPDWANKAIDAWISRRLGRPYKFSKTLKKSS